MSSLIAAASSNPVVRSAAESPRSVRFASDASVGAAAAPAPSEDAEQSSSSTLKFVLSGLRSRFAHSSGSLRDMFREWDTDKSGDVDASELTVALHSLGFTAVTPRDSEVLIANIDIGGDGKVQYDDFVRLLCPPKQEMRSVTCSEADVARINALVPPTELNLPGRVFFMGGRAVKRVLGPGEAAALRHSSLGDVGNGVASDPLRESVLASVDAAETTIRRGFYKDLLGSSSSSSSSQQQEGLAVSEAEEGAQAAEATLSHLRATASASATASSSSTSPLRRTTARREARVELASLPPAVQVDLLMSRGLLPQYQLSAQAPRLRAPWEHASAEPGGPSMEERIAAAHASNAAGAAHAARLAAGEVGEEEGGMAHSGAVHVSALYGASSSSSSSSRQLPEVPTHLSLPISPLARTAATAARRGAGSVPALVLPGTHRGALAPSTTVTLSHPLSYLTALGSSALAPPPQLLHTLLAAGSSSGDSTTAAAAAAAGPATAPPNSLDRSLHASGRLPARSEGLSGPLSSTGAPYQHDAVVPDGGSGTVVVGHLQGAGKGCESVTAVGASAIALVSGPFFSSTVQRELDRRINRLRLSAQDVLELPAVGRPTAPHVTQPAQAAVPPFSPLRSGRSSTVRGNFAAAAAGQQGSGSGSAVGSGAGGQEGFYPSGVPMDTRRLQRHEARRREFFTAAGLELPSPKEGSSSSSSSSAPEVTLAGRLSSSRNLRQSRLGSILGLVNPLTQGADAAAAAAAAAEGSSSRHPGLPPLDFGTLASISTAHTAGGSRVLATAVRHEGERTTFLLASPPSLRTELTPEHPSYHYASSARLAQTGTAIPEQAFGRLARVDALHGLRERALERAAAERSQHDHDFNFAQSDIASRIARKREERGAYKASIFARKLHQERTLCAPFPVGDVQI